MKNLIRFKSSVRQIAGILLIAVAFLIGCFRTLDVTPADVEKQINAALKPGDSAETIEQYFSGRGLGYSYNKRESRYKSIIRHPDSNFHAIVIYVWVDKQKKFVKAEAHNSYTFL